MASLAVQIEVLAVQINPAANTNTIQVGLAPGDTSGLSSFSMSWTASGPPRYSIGATTTLNLP